MSHPPGFRPERLLTFIQVPPFPGQFHRLKLTDEDLRGIEITILDDPRQGVVVAGTHGLRKMRFARRGSNAGKSGAYRIFYLHLEEYGTVFLWAIILKGEAENLSAADREAIGRQVLRARQALERGVE
ncbi:Toxin HigB-2 [Aquisphaera giovannonii]|uniref:Toxin HigB-2 n=1 Tax=Aquisphaera giovannonii TaxID=406548 RepID=A0A5B9WED1_9BACT|nr:hypothetical protein [Aquisphaera giovannonii]QEH39016.1 Toxin HigB-2 [Aquisphaera giovannonii]